jgi:hypothetical protein
MDSPISIIEEHPYGRRRTGTNEYACEAILKLKNECAFVFMRVKCTNYIELTSFTVYFLGINDL